MKDELAPSSEIQESQNGSERSDDFVGDGDSTVGKSISITLSPGTSLIVPGEEKIMRRPFQPLSASTPSPSCSSRVSKSRSKSPTEENRIKCVFIGDSKIGKSALIHSFLHGHGENNTPEYVPTLQDTHLFPIPVKTTRKQEDLVQKEKKELNENKDVVDKEGEGQRNDLILQICDTGGQEEMDRLRPLCYSHAQMVVICFSVMNPSSFSNVTLKWLPEVKRHRMGTKDPKNPLKLLLVGTQSDLRSNVNLLLKLMNDGLAPISETQALRLANKIGALKYVESSSLTTTNVNHVFDLVMTYGNGKHHPKEIMGLPLESGLQEKILPNITERKVLFWRRWRNRQNKSSTKMKRLVLLPCFF